MVIKFMHWIKENGWIIVGIFLTVNIIYIYFTDKYYYYNAKGKKVKNKWVTVKVKGKKQKYYFNKKGAALTGTAAVKNRLYGID